MFIKKSSCVFIIVSLWFCMYVDESADDNTPIALPANTPAQGETLLDSLRLAAAGIGLHVNAHKMGYMCFNQRDNVSTLNSSSLKLVYYWGSSLINRDRHQRATSKGMDSYR